MNGQINPITHFQIGKKLKSMTKFNDIMKIVLLWMQKEIGSHFLAKIVSTFYARKL